MGFVFPCSRREIIAASLPTTCPLASIRYHSLVWVAKLYTCVHDTFVRCALFRKHSVEMGTAAQYSCSLKVYTIAVMQVV